MALTPIETGHQPVMDEWFAISATGMRVEFDYSSLRRDGKALALEDRERIRGLVSEIHGLTREYRREIGRRLVEIKSMVDHGGFVELVRECFKLNHRSANRYMLLTRFSDGDYALIAGLKNGKEPALNVRREYELAGAAPDRREAVIVEIKKNGGKIDYRVFDKILGFDPARDSRERNTEKREVEAAIELRKEQSAKVETQEEIDNLYQPVIAAHAAFTTELVAAKEEALAALRERSAAKNQAALEAAARVAEGERLRELLKRDDTEAPLSIVTKTYPALVVDNTKDEPPPEGDGEADGEETPAAEASTAPAKRAGFDESVIVKTEGEYRTDLLAYEAQLRREAVARCSSATTSDEERIGDFLDRMWERFRRGTLRFALHEVSRLLREARSRTRDSQERAGSASVRSRS
jgi:hypothetical protein